MVGSYKALVLGLNPKLKLVLLVFKGFAVSNVLFVAKLLLVDGNRLMLCVVGVTSTSSRVCV